MSKALRKYVVGVFKNGPECREGYSAYLRDYNPRWSGCTVVSVLAATGNEAKKLAITQVKNATERGAE